MKNKFTTHFLLSLFLCVLAFSSQAQLTLTVDSPSGISGVYNMLPAGFGGEFPGACNVLPPITGELEIGEDGTDPTSDACEALVNDLTGKIALIDRGACSFSQKCANAEAAGAIAVIVCNNNTDAIFNMGNTAGFVNTIPALMISLADCNIIRAEIPNVNVTIDFNLVQPVENTTVLWDADLTPLGSADWTTMANVADSILDVWVYDDAGTFPTGGGNTVAIPNGWSVCNPAWGFPARFYQTNRTGDDAQIPADPGSYEEYNSELVSPSIDLSAVTGGVSLKFDQYFQRLNGNVDPGLTNISTIEYSIDDGATWSDPIEINADMAANDPARESIERVGLPGASGNANVRVKFVFQGDFYFWLVSRIQIIEREAHNMQANSFYSIAPSLLTPECQTDSVQFLIDVENIGAQDQEGVNVNVNVVNSANTEVYNEDLAYGTVASNFVDENRIFPGSFVPPAGIVDTYTATYSVSADSTDFDLSNNSQSFTFFVTDSVFAKEDNVGIFGVTSPAATTELTWTMASTYFVKNGEDAVDPNIKYECSSVLIGLANLEANVGGFITIYLYEWEDVNLDGIAQNTERNGSTGGDVLGNLTYEIEAGTPDALDLLVSLENFNNSGEPLQLKANTTYVLAAGLTSAGVSKIQTTGNNENDYGATNFLTDSIGVERISCMWNTTSDDGGLNSDLEQVIFNPRMRMHVNKFAEVSVNRPLDIANKVNVYPNPASEVVNMELDLVENLNNAIVRIVDLNARNVMEVIYDELSSQTLTYSVANLAAGTYFLKIQSDKGYITKKFTVAK